MLDKIILQNFLRFSEFSFKQPGSINLIIGENDTGKTGLLRLLYAAAKSLEVVSRSRKSATDTSLFKSTFSRKLDTVFNPVPLWASAH
jgi:AAA15 family ATPase/GTPase